MCETVLTVKQFHGYMILSAIVSDFDSQGFQQTDSKSWVIEYQRHVKPKWELGSTVPGYP